ncbi:SCP2 sterol-binding domain-containing protein [Propionivibrio sp.]|uniref:ubiquinone anaerobic biosynthesis accessory factor UbiT n=1 Tax=Propionivibrio sp. TaxID=2212460 RepID=UPI0025EA98D6|nr:SCP2 sterol-binding domain-containing protein [Propionivibrio sp.]MBK7355255.1 SCP2 sterol-binding domain-containing protein [Propionivibrio sp.]MBK8399650.1 SCP2 sterol-binding domain-containing protein [Propionivibrio sp.]MBK8744943.1 SCP2 sterol-binding domain-containing protein [Propionivibrio sp.]MBK8893543.1 SCP2 sterol-binding domain-containing protein [Propionivibrio sp.]MBL0208630.1 SCP2 sterol-binding domain-containing protein [Propionivibrio sp.]
MSEIIRRPFSIPRFTLPTVFAVVGSKLPQWPHAVALTAGLNVLVKMKLLPQDSLELLEERRFVVDVLDSGGRACFTFRDGLFRPLFSWPETPDLVFSANLSAFLQLLARQEDPDTLFFNRELSIEGDTELGLVVKNMLDAVEWPKLPRLPGLASLFSFRH